MADWNRWGEDVACLLARVEDLAARAERGTIAYSPFLTPKERFAVSEYVRVMLPSAEVCFYGGYPEAQRTRAFFLPDYFAGILPPETDESYETVLRDLLGEILEEALCPLTIHGSGYRTLTHRDFLGALTGLGIDRAAMGDIAVKEERDAVLLCDGRIAVFLESHLEKVGSDTVKLSRGGAIDPADFAPVFVRLQDTVASDRADCVVASLIRAAREKAQDAIGTGAVEHNYLTLHKNDQAIKEGDILSVRGYGKYVIRSLSDTTKKGRLRLIADKYS